MVDLVVYPMNANKAFFGSSDNDHPDGNFKSSRHGLIDPVNGMTNSEPTSSETNSSGPEASVYGEYGGAHSEYASDGEESRFSTSTGSYQVGRRRKLNYVAVDCNSVDGDGDSRKDHFKREMHRLADSMIADSIREDEDGEKRSSDTADNASISSTSSAHEEAADLAQSLHDALEALEVCPPNTLRYDMDVEVQRLLQRNKRVLLTKLVECGARRNLTMINLSRRGISVNEAMLLKETIETNQQLYVLRLPYNQLGDEGAAIIAAALSNAGTQHHQLSILDLGFNAIGDAGAGSIAVDCVAANPHLQCLYLSGNHIQEKGAMSIAGGILHGSSIEKLSMAGNRLKPNGIKTLVAAISQNDARIQTLRAHSDNPNDEKFKVFETLDFSYTSMMSEGFPSLPGMILSNSSLKSLNVSGNYLNDNDLLLLSQALTQNKCVPLETIDFSFNHITCVGVEGLMNAVWGSETLRHLNLCKTRIKDRGAQLCAVVLTSIKLETLNIGFNKITSLGVKTLMKNVSENDSLESLTLSGIQMDQSSAKAISFALAHCHSLRQVHLDSSLDGFALQRHIVAGIVSNRLSKLHVLTGFNIGPIATTLGMPKLPVEWSNDQVLGFFRLMWSQWLLKARHGSQGSTELAAQPAAPAAVAIAAKIAFSSLGSDIKAMFATQPAQKPISDQASVEPAASSLLERRNSGTVVTPLSNVNSEVDFNDFVDGEGVRSTRPASLEGSRVSSDTRNQEWLRQHYRSLCDVGNLPFRTADLWQLHQYFFSPPAQTELEETQSLLLPHLSPLPGSASLHSQHLPADQRDAALSNTFNSQSSQKRMSSTMDGISSEPQAKKAKNFKGRIAYFPRTLEKVQRLKTQSPIQVLALLRQLKYVEASLFNGRSPYHDGPSLPAYPTCSDVDYLLTDLL